MKRPPRRGWHAALTGLSLLSYALGCWAFHPFVADDAFIVGRYALNAAQGHGLVYNLGEPVSALTSPLQALISTALAFLTDDPVGLYRVLVLALPPLGWLAAAMLLDLRGGRLALFSAVALAPPFVALWAWGGLETPILSFLLTLFGAVVVRAARAGSAGGGHFLALGVISGLAFLTRFDSILLTLPPMLMLVAPHRRDWRLWASAGVALAIAGAWLVFAAVTYGSVLPTSAYVKLGEATSSQLVGGAFAVANFAVLSGLAFGAPLMRAAPTPGSDASRLATGVVYAAVLFAAYALVASAQHMMFGYRFFVPVLPLVGLILALTVARGRLLVAALVLGVNAALGVSVARTGMNPFPIPNLFGAAITPPELHDITPRTYGALMATLKADAADLVEHWAAQGKDRPPRIFLITGGTGYWLSDAYVFETLVSARLDCSSDQLVDQFRAMDYVQYFSFMAISDDLRAFVLRRPDMQPPAIVSRSEVDFGGPSVVEYLYGDSPADLRWPARLTDSCQDLPATGG